MTFVLSPDQLESFHKEGALCIPGFLTPVQIAKLMEKSRQLLQLVDITTHPMTQFRTGADGHVGEQYFLDSSNKVSYFFDVDAFDDDGKLTYPKEVAINKIGHNVHELEPLFHDITFTDEIRNITKTLEFEDPRVLQSMIIFKHPTIDETKLERLNEVPPHTDGTFLFTKPQSAIGFWFALEDCTKDNGCLSFNPGSHRYDTITERFVKIDGGDKGCGFIPVESSNLNNPIPQNKSQDYKLIECKAGSLILIHNSVLHKSENNKSNKSRFAYTFHVIDGVAEYDNLNWLQVPPGKQGGTEFSKLY